MQLKKLQFKTHVWHELNSHVRALLFSVVPNNINYWRGPSQNESKGEIYYLTIRLRAQVFYEQIVNEAQPSWLSLVENEAE